jgi:hypothetical protein
MYVNYSFGATSPSPNLRQDASAKMLVDDRKIVPANQGPIAHSSRSARCFTAPREHKRFDARAFKVGRKRAWLQEARADLVRTRFFVQREPSDTTGDGRCPNRCGIQNVQDGYGVHVCQNRMKITGIGIHDLICEIKQDGISATG